MQYITIILTLCTSLVYVKSYTSVCPYQDDFLYDSFAYQNLVPDMAPTFPDAKICGFYKNGEEIDLGNNLTPIGTREAPSIDYPCRPNRFYTLALLGDYPDPEKPEFNTTKKHVFIHWMIVNVEGCEPKIGEVVYDYIGPFPPRGDALHRYVLFMYTQPWRLKFGMPYVNSSTIEGRYRTMSSFHRFLKTYRYRSPIYGNFFFSEFDKSVPELRNRLGLDKVFDNMDDNNVNDIQSDY